MILILSVLLVVSIVINVGLYLDIKKNYQIKDNQADLIYKLKHEINDLRDDPNLK